MADSKSKLSHIEQFNGTNFQLWKYNCWLILEQNDLLDIVEVISLRDILSLVNQIVNPLCSIVTLTGKVKGT
jgi:hypothetical protein